MKLNIIAYLFAMNRHIRPNKTCLTPPPFTEVLVPSQEYAWSVICVFWGYYFFFVLLDIVLLRIIPRTLFFIQIFFHLDIFVIIHTYCFAKLEKTVYEVLEGIGRRRNSHTNYDVCSSGMYWI